MSTKGSTEQQPDTSSSGAPLRITSGAEESTVANIVSEDGSVFQMLSTRRPKDAMAGLSSGLKNIGKGVFGGLASLVVLPVQGAQEDGVRGFVTGLGLGVVSAATLAVAGVGTGVVQLGRGIINTPHAISSKMKEKIWDERKREWIEYNLLEEAEEVLNSIDENVILKGGAVDSTFYDRLGVEPTASRSDIKRAYRTKALELHPDKNPDDPNASDNFQKLGAAYQVLMDDQLREAYDKGGQNAVSGQDKFLDSSQLFEFVFGSQHFENFVGELKILSMTKGLEGFSPSSDMSEDQQRELFSKSKYLMEKNQLVREVQCAVKLAGYLVNYIMDETPEHSVFKEFIVAEAKELTTTAFGGTLIGVLGYVYEEQATEFLGFKAGVAAGLGIGKMAKSAHIAGNTFRMMSSVVKAYSVAKKAEKEMKEKEKEKAASEQSGGEGSEREVPPPKTSVDSDGPSAKEKLGTLVETMWNLTVLDVESTLRKVCFKVLKDTSVSLEERILRAEGLLVMSRVFQEYGRSFTSGLDEIQEKMMAMPTPSAESEFEEI